MLAGRGLCPKDQPQRGGTSRRVETSSTSLNVHVAATGLRGTAHTLLPLDLFMRLSRFFLARTSSGVALRTEAKFFKFSIDKLTFEI
jgi:hypothetical protein